MSTPSPSDDRLDQILAELLAVQSHDSNIDYEKVIAEHPEFAAEIRAFLSNQNHLKIGDTTNAFTPIDPSRSPRIGNFKLLQRLGEGGMGEVWMADQERPVKRRVAIKLIKPGMDSRAVLARFDAERQALALMNHPNIAKVFEAGIVTDEDKGIGTGRPYFVMELVKGIPITQFCDERRLPIQERLELFRQSCSAVHHAHQKGIIHRDLKPGNILVESHDDRPVLKVIDFGLAKAVGGTQLTEQTLFTALGAIAGTPLYMAPEQAVLNAIDIDIRADIYSLGVLLYELLTGTTPLTKETLHQKGVEELLKMIREHDPPKPSLRLSASDALPSIAAMRQVEPIRLGRFVRGELDWIVMKALAKERERRYSSAMAFSDDIFHFLNQEPVDASPPSTSYMLRKFASRHRGIVLAASAVTGALGIGLVGTTIGFMRAQQVAVLERRARQESIEARDQAVAAKNVAELEAYIANISLIQSAIENGDYGTAKKRLLACPVSLRGFEWQFLNRQAQFVVATLPDPVPESELGYTYSHDESLVLVHLDANTLRLYDLKGNTVSEPFVHPAAVQSAAFSLDDQWIITSCDDGNVRMWNARTKTYAPRLVGKRGNASREFRMLGVPDRFITLDNGNTNGFKIWNYQGVEVVSDFLRMNPDLIFRDNSADGTMLLQQGDRDIFLVNANGEVVKEFKSSSECMAEFHAGGNVVVVTYKPDSGQYSLKVWNKQSDSLTTGVAASIFTTSGQGKLLLTTQSDIFIENSMGMYDCLNDEKRSRRFDYAPYEMDSARHKTKLAAVIAMDEYPVTVSVWDECGVLIKRSVFANRGATYYVPPYIEFDRDRPIIAVRGNTTQAFSLVEIESLKSITFPLRGDLKKSSFAASKDFPVLASCGEDEKPMMEASLWSEGGTRLGSATVSTSGATKLGQSNLGIVGTAVTDLNNFDNGISTLDYGSLGRLEAAAMLESCNHRVKENVGGVESISVQVSGNRVSLVKNNIEMGSVDTFAPNPVAMYLPSESLPRVVVADGKNLRFFSDSMREIAAFRQKQSIADVNIAKNGPCIILSFKDDTHLAWDLRSLSDKQKYWKECGDEFRPATEYVEQLLSTNTPSDQLMTVCLSDGQLSAKRKWGVARLLEEEIALSRVLANELLNAYSEECLHSKTLLGRKLQSLQATTSSERRKLEQAKQLLETMKLSLWESIELCLKILAKPELQMEEYQRVLIAIQEANSADPRSQRVVAVLGGAHFRLGEYEKASEILTKVVQSELPNDELRLLRLFLAMCQYKLGNSNAAAETLQLVQLPENAGDVSKSLFSEASSLIHRK